MATTIRLVSALPEIAAVVPPAERSIADRVQLAVVSARDEDLAEALGFARLAFDYLIVEGVVLKETTLARRSALELLGPDDLLARPLSALRQVESRAASRYVARGRVSVAVLDARFGQAARRWPGVLDVVGDRLGRQAHRASVHLAMLHLPRVEDRLVALFVDLGERFGRVTSDGIVIDLNLTHEVIGGLVASRRPTVSLALQGLASVGVLTRVDANRWRLARSALSL
jgi:CRP-like cAMP-binding protein